jgi:hypothetical protein
VDISAAEFRSFEWGNHHYPIPGFTVIKTSLHAGKWAEAPGIGTVLLAYHPSTVSGAVVLCVATLASRVVGVSPETQKQLLHRISHAVSASTTAASDSSNESAQAVPPKSIDEFLEQELEIGAAYLLCRLAVADPDSADLTEVAKNQLAIQLPVEDARRLKRRLPLTPPAEVRAALHRFGWGAYLRRLGSPTSTTNPGASTT